VSTYCGQNHIAYQVWCRAKYPLVVIDCLLNVYGSDGALAYDIDCAFATILTNSVLDPCARALNLFLMVGTFHGHAHNHQCQLNWHPMYIPGTGCTQGEGCEHVFSASNALARGTQHASSFHRHQAIEQHFSFWNMDKSALSKYSFCPLSSFLICCRFFLMKSLL